MFRAPHARRSADADIRRHDAARQAVAAQMPSTGTWTVDQTEPLLRNRVTAGAPLRCHHSRSRHGPRRRAGPTGSACGAIIDADDLDGILELAEDMADIRAAEAARAEMRITGETPIPWKKVKADLGLT